ncbi:MAG: hypothetical protein DHS20C13_00580 [Thermodesulfobacteriota bacterium]|nr:MAG: hypothetical protein DHS20C13_00580 [Thermodesulfobacteriota bacterium]
MKRSINLILTLSLVFLVLACSGSEDESAKEVSDKQESPTTSFRKSNWGMTPEEVKATESAIPISDNENLVLYQETFLNMPAKMGYVFKDGKLIKGAYLFEERFENPDDYILSYEKVKNSVIIDLGPPSLDEIKWVDEDSSQLEASGSEVCEGKVVYRSEWVERDTLVTLLLEGANNKCRQGIVFQSKSNYLIENPENENFNESNPN